jgi:hypothetical protein
MLESYGVIAHTQSLLLDAARFANKTFREKVRGSEYANACPDKKGIRGLLLAPAKILRRRVTVVSLVPGRQLCDLDARCLMLNTKI